MTLLHAVESHQDRLADCRCIVLDDLEERNLRLLATPLLLFDAKAVALFTRLDTPAALQPGYLPWEPHEELVQRVEEARP